jgi:4-amino-4-deoxy-L-arabinose transferase-like glycosyltransferase
MRISALAPHRRWLAAAGFLSVALLLFAAISRAITDPNIVLLLPQNGAKWIVVNEPLHYVARRPGSVVAQFRAAFVVQSAPRSVPITIHALGQANVFLDNQLVLETNRGLHEWKQPLLVELGDKLGPGPHVLQIVVTNQNGPAAVMAHCASLNLFSGSNWQASRDGRFWTAARPADTAPINLLASKFPRTDQAILRVLPLLVPLFAVAFVWRRHPALLSTGAWPAWFRITPGRVRWLLLLAWAVLGLNNLLKLPIRVGFDVAGHLDYIRVIALQGRIPLANEGWQMFQPPLYHLVTAPLYLLSFKFFAANTAAQLLRIVPLLCGAAQIELCLRAMRHAFPQRWDLQALGTVLGALFPMNVYASQALGNEPLTGCLSAGVIVVAFRLLAVPDASLSRWWFALLGLLLGLAMLTKPTAVLLAPPVAGLVTYVAIQQGRSAGRVIAALALVFAVAFAVAGWYYIRNWVLLGHPFVGGWDPRRGIVWWQDPGYRTLNQFLGFGVTLIRPIYAGTAGFSDAFYSTLWLDGWLSSSCVYETRPPWNYPFLIAGAWLGLLPTAGILLGVAVAFRDGQGAGRGCKIFALVCLVVYLAAMLNLYLHVPIYSTVKATYTLGLLPAYAVLGTAGLEVMMRGPISRALVGAGIACWAVAAYAAYFVL